MKLYNRYKRKQKIIKRNLKESLKERDQIGIINFKTYSSDPYTIYIKRRFKAEPYQTR
jgi:hypothetical protein